MNTVTRSLVAILIAIAFSATAWSDDAKEVVALPGTQPLTLEGDIASHLVDGVDKFLLQEIAKSVPRREEFWKRDFSSPEAYQKSIEPNRKRLAHILGVRDPRVAFDAPEYVATTKQSSLVGKGDGYEIYAIRWPVLADPDPGRDVVTIHGEGLLLVPTRGNVVADIIAIPDADQTPEQIAGLSDGVPAESQFARRLAESGCRVVVPVLVSRERQRRAPPGRGGGANLTNREYLYRSAFELGRHLIGYEVQKMLACVDWFAKEAGDGDPKIGVAGYGEGGMLALYAAALDTRIDVSLVSGYFDDRNDIWQQPIDRNVFGLLEQFGDAELAAMIPPRSLIVDCARGPESTLAGEGGAPAKLVSPQKINKEWERRVDMIEGLPDDIIYRQRFVIVVRKDGQTGETRKPFCTDTALEALLKELGAGALAESGSVEQFGKLPDAALRQRRQIEQIDQHNQLLLRESPFVRREYMNMSWTQYDNQDGSNKLDTSSIENYEKSIERYREHFRDDVIGRFDIELLEANPRTRMIAESDKWTRYEVVLDVFPDVIAYGILTLPKGMKDDERRPVVVCQHGLEGRPQSVIGEEQFQYYKAFATALAERGFITFAPQNLYIFQDRFRTLQRKANPLGKTLFSIIVPQHQQIVNWLKTHPNVDGERIAFYGLSYGGKSAMRIPALVTDYCLSICSADFNEWVLKNASTRHPFSYVWTGEYEIFEFDLGSTFNYAEMAALIAPRPFMVERGHQDGVGWDEYVGYEFAKVRHLYAARLGLADRCEIEWFAGPHSINGEGTYDFLHKHLNWPKPE